MSDTKISFEVERNPAPGKEMLRSGLKTFFLGPQIAVAYSGTVETAHQTIRRARTAAANGAAPTELVELFREQCKQGADNEFLLALVTNGRQIIKITPTIFSESEESPRWIGSAEAANLVLGEPFDSAISFARRFQQAL